MFDLTQMRFKIIIINFFSIIFPQGGFRYVWWHQINKQCLQLATFLLLNEI